MTVLEPCDVITCWTWQPEHLALLAESLAQAEALAPGERFVLGCCMWDYNASRPMPLALLQRQCWQGLEWLRSGRIEGLLFLASWICDLGLEAVEWVRRWSPKWATHR